MNVNRPNPSGIVFVRPIGIYSAFEEVKIQQDENSTGKISV